MHRVVVAIAVTLIFALAPALRADPAVPIELTGHWRTHLESDAHPVRVHLTPEGRCTIWLGDDPDAAAWKLAAWYDPKTRTLSIGKSIKKRDEPSFEFDYDPETKLLNPRRLPWLKRALVRVER